MSRSSVAITALPTLLFAFAGAMAMNGGSAAAASGRMEALHVFKGTPDGNYPSNRLLPLAGAYYGAVAYGGQVCAATPLGCGAIFEVFPGPHGTVEKLIYRFKGQPSDGLTPGSGALIADKSGALYGTTIGGGNGSCDYFGTPGCGVVFKLTPSEKPDLG